ncbi:MAG: hypothetical protein ABMB14_29140 [Myxococcota bacterium]
MFGWMVAAAVAAPAGFTVSKTTDACTIYTGPATDGVTPLLAECTWPEIQLAHVDALFSRWADHDAMFSVIAASDVVKTDGGFAYVHQVHETRGISARECVLKMHRTEGADGLEFGWTLAPDQPPVADGRVAVAHDDGYWKFAAAAGGGVTVTHFLAYDPGGSVPGFVVRAFQGSGFEGSIRELRAYLSSH